MKHIKLFTLILISVVLFGVFQATPTEASQTSFKIQFKNAVFDPLVELPEFPEALTLSENRAQTTDTLILQFNGPVLQTWKDELIAQGVEFGPYIPDHAFIVRIPEGNRAEVGSLDFVRWIGTFEPGFKVSENVDPFNDQTYKIHLLPWHQAYDTIAALETIQPNIDFLGDQAAGKISPEDIITIANLPGVLWIEPLSFKKYLNDQAGGNFMNGAAAWSSGYTGTGIMVGAVDSGLDTGVTPLTHPDFSGGRVLNISSYPVYDYDFEGCGSPQNLGADDGAADFDSGHGTHIMGSIAGDGTASSGLYKGLAHSSLINFQAMEQFVVWQPGCPTASGYYPMFPSFLNMPLEEAYSWGVRIHNNSWGGAGYGVYDSDAVDYDSFAYDNPNFLMTVAAGNEGIDLDADGYVDTDSLLSPGTAKNVLTIGASESVPSTPGGYTGYQWNAWTGMFTGVTGSDWVSNNPMHMAAISSTGPTDDGRIKPDLVAPGTDIISTKATWAAGSGWGSHPNPTYSSTYMYNGGTSMSSALAAGAAALVREYYTQTENITDPSAALIKATLINTAVDIDGYGNPSFEAGQPIPNMHEGWGLIDVGAATNGSQRMFFDEPKALNTGEIFTYGFEVGPNIPFKATLVWTDPEATAAANPTLVNDLNLTVMDSSGTIFKGNVFNNGWSFPGGSADTVNNVENVYIQAPPPGHYTITISGASVNVGPQDFALVVQGETIQPIINLYIPAIISSGGAPLPADPIQDGGFEAASTPWWLHEKKYNNLITNNPVHNGIKAVTFNGALMSNSFVSQPLTIPPERPFLHFWYSINSNDPLCGPGGTLVNIYIDSLPLDTIYICQPQNTGWVERVVDLSPFAGAAIQTIRFEVETNGNPNSSFYLDDISLENMP